MPPRDPRRRFERPREGEPKPRVFRGPEIRVCGLNAVNAVFERDPDAIRRAYFDRELVRQTARISRHLALKRRPYQLVEGEELARLAGTAHHGGIVAMIAPPEIALPSEADVAGWAKAREKLLILDGIANHHNLGAILRSAAFFGVRVVILSERPDQALPSDAVYRVAEGGMEHVKLYRPPALAAFCRTLSKAGYRVVGAAVDGKPLAPPPAGEARPVALVLGNEEAGLSPAVTGACDATVKIPGTGKIESLNVSVAAGILMHALLARPQ